MADDRFTEDMVWLGNYGYYNEGELVGDWLALPYVEDELPGFLASRVGVDEWHEEFGIFDVDLCGPLGTLGVRVGEFSHLDGLNVLATLAAGVDDGELGRVAAFIDHECLRRTPLAVANILAQRAELPVHRLAGEASEFRSELDRLGRTAAEEAGGVSRLSRETRLANFDYAGYGEEMIHEGAVIVGGGYIVPDWCGVDTSRFDLDDVLEELGPADGDDLEGFDGNVAALGAAFGHNASPEKFGEIADSCGETEARALAALEAAAVGLLTDDERERADAYVRECLGWSDGPVEVANVLLQLDEVYYRPLPDTPGSPVERLGMAIADELGIDDGDLERHFDFESYGADLSGDYAVSGDYYIDCAADYPLEDRYDLADLRRLLEPDSPSHEQGHAAAAAPATRRRI